MEKGYIKLHRELGDNNVWLSEPFTKGQAWVDLLLLTNYKSSFIRLRNGEMVQINRGECGYSMETLAQRWSWSRGKVKRYFDFLKSEKMIQQKDHPKTTIIKVLNFESYQERTSNDTSNGHQTDTNKKDKKDKKSINTLSLSINSRRLGKRERELLESYCRNPRNNIKNPKGFIATVSKNGDWVDIVESEKKRLNRLEQLKNKVTEEPQTESPELTQKGFEAAQNVIKLIRKRG